MNTKNINNKTKSELLEMIHDLEASVERLERYKQYENMANELAGMRLAFENAGFSKEESFQAVMQCMRSAAEFAKPSR